MRKTILMFTCLLTALSARAADDVVVDLAEQNDNPPAVYVPIGKDARVVGQHRLPKATYTVDNRKVAPALDPPPKAPADKCTVAGSLEFITSQMFAVAEEKDLDGAAKAAKKALKDDCKDKPVAKDEEISAKITGLTTFDVGSYPVTATTDLTLSISRVGRKWPVVIQPSRTKAELDVAKTAASNVKGLNDILNRQNSADTVKHCIWKDPCDATPVYINADHVGIAYITGIPADASVVRVSAGEHFTDCGVLDSNYRSFTEGHDTIVVPLVMRSAFTGKITLAKSRNQYGLQAYGLIDRPVKEGDLASLCVENAQSLFTSRRASSQMTTYRIGDDEFPSVPLMLRGKSELVTVEIVQAGGRRTFQIPIRYQRFWLDAGGFFAFSRHMDEDLIKEPAETGKVKVTQVRENKDVNPSTGIVVNIHPGNYPYYAWQFGIAAQQNRLPSYYLGVGLRAREIGKHSLATVAVGLAAVQSNRFNGLHLDTQADDSRSIVLPSDSPLLTPSPKYTIEPYISISLGFSFGGVSDRPDTVVSPPGGGS
ncbi:MAG: hypothetical protein ABI779_13935 [Acidobacteriota bacterium]